MHMSLGWKAATLVLLNVVLTFSAGLLARNLVLNPELAKVERSNDEKILRQLQIIEGMIASEMTDSVNRFKRLAVNVDASQPSQFFDELAELGAESDLSFVLIASTDSSLLEVLPARHYSSGSAPSANEISQILDVVEGHGSGDKVLVTLATTETGPTIIAADRLKAWGGYSDTFFVAVSRINDNFIEQLNRLAGVEINLITAEQYQKLQNEPKALSGLRSESNHLQWSVPGFDRKPVIMASIDLPPRSYDDRILSPTLAIALLITLATWSVAIWLLHRAIILPMNKASKTLKTIMEDKDYGRQLEYKHYDEFGRLVAFCNRLLGMVDKQTTELQTLSLTDPLTELNNRRAFDAQSQKFWALAERSNTRMALIAFDIDHFKSYNDRYGHPAGDKVIKAFARILEHTFKRASDVVARVGGEEFLVMTQDTPAGACLVLTNRVLQELRDLRLEHADNPVGCVTASAGVFQATPDANLSLEISLIRTDEILYAAKHEGRNRAMYSDALVNSMSTIKTADIHQLPRNS